MRFLTCVLLLIASVGVTGCGATTETDQEKLARLVPDAARTFPVKGKIMVDGKPAPERAVWVTLHAKGESPLKFNPRGSTNEKGEFEITTYIAGDGAPPGDYDITIEHLTLSVRDKDWVGPDKFNNLYNHPEAAEFHVSVVDKPVELPAFELKVEGVTPKEAPKVAPVSKDER
jgi:hypothetical protein